ncbi:helix-turn-helix transcriptional regulator [Sphingobium chungbukense]|uniref:AlpA family transcriptional regulator n=1 Tax=Sphingobium chungbukense TaxID=56193 RepID=A0A0M3B048_9SPHN|nr:AlpA family phage regulatory protein [Sphingobium chungbukense]KKW94184.1 AlpA family transcriptional regulator [Sphingobium chungbukense]
MENINDRRRDNLLRIAEVKARTTLSSATIYRRISAGTFPRPHRISAGLTAWYESEIDSWVADPMGYRAGVQNEVGV